MNKERLLNVARALRESPNPDQFTMQTYSKGCGTPACAFGHYCHRTDLQSEFRLDPNGVPIDVQDTYEVGYYRGKTLEHFDITEDQSELLFAAPDESYCDMSDEGTLVGGGCGNARTALEAAEWVEKFVANEGEVDELA